MWVEVTEIHFFATFYSPSVCLLKCPLGGNESDACHTHTHTLQFQRSCFSVHIIQFHFHVIIPFIHNQSPSVAFHSTHRQLSWRSSWFYFHFYFFFLYFCCWWKGLPRRIDLPSDRREVAEKEHHLDSSLRSISSLFTAAACDLKDKKKKAELLYSSTLYGMWPRRRRGESITSKPDGKYRHSSNMNWQHGETVNKRNCGRMTTTDSLWIKWSVRFHTES